MHRFDAGLLDDEIQTGLFALTRDTINMNHLGFEDIFAHAFTSAPASADERVTKMIRAWSQSESGSPYPVGELKDLSGLFSECAPPHGGMPFDALLDQIERDILPNTPKLNHPMYAGHMTQALPWFSSAIEALAVALNQNQVKIETAFASTLVEKQTLAWLHRLAYGPQPSGNGADPVQSGVAIGNLVSGGTIGNLTALAVALETAMPGVREHGLHASLREYGYAGVAVVGSARMHYSLRKAMGTLGMGSAALHLVPVGRDNRVLLDAARTQLSKLRDADVKVIALVGVAGATETGSIDPLPELAGLAREMGCWYHVDAAWGGALLLSRTRRELLAGIEQADSIVLDGHKLFYVPMAQGAVIFKNPDGPERLRHTANYILRAHSGDLGQTSLEGSRRFDALKLWATIKLIGTDGYDAIFARVHRLGRQFCELLNAHPDFELMTWSETFIYTYRYIPAAWSRQLKQHQAEQRAEMVLLWQAALNGLNAEIQERLKRSGKGFVSRTLLESTAYPGDTVVLRAVLTNVHTTATHLAELLRLHSDIGAALVAEGIFSPPLGA